MPFKTDENSTGEEKMKRAINAIEQGYGAGKWIDSALIDQHGNSCAIGLIAKSNGATDFDLFDGRKTIGGAVRAGRKWLGLGHQEAQIIFDANDEFGHLAAIESIRKIGFDTEGGGS